MYSLHFDLLLKVFLFSHHYIDAFYMQGQIHSFSIRGVRTHLKVEPINIPTFFLLFLVFL